MTNNNASHKLTAIFYADVVGYSRLTCDDELGTHLTVMSMLDFATETIKTEGGIVLRYAGDAVLAEFPSVIACVNAGVVIQTELAVRNHDKDKNHKALVRIGINLGEVLEDRGEIYGEGVNLAARLEAAAQPGGICISSTVHDQIEGKLDILFTGGEEETFKNIAKSVRVYRWNPDMAPSIIHRNKSRQGAAANKPTIAVLAFDNLSEDKGQDYLGDGISEDLITALSKIRWFTVIARNSTFTYKGQAVDITKISEELGARYVLEGSVRKAGKRVRVTAQLIDAHTGEHIWANRYDRDIEDVFALQDEMTQTIVGRVEPELSAAERNSAKNKPPENLNAWESFHQGIWHMWNYGEEDIEQALVLLDQAIGLDPGFSPSHGYKAYALFVRVVQGWATQPDEDIRVGFESAKRALQLDDRDPIAYFAIGRIYMMQGDLDASIRSIRIAIDLNPSFSLAYHGLGMALTLAGDLDGAKKALEESDRLSPRDPIRWASMAIYSLIEILAGNFESAIDWSHKTVQMPRASGYWPHATLASALGNQGKIDEAKAALVIAMKNNPNLSVAYFKKTLVTRQSEGLDPYLNGLRKAGLEE